ncbi:MAG: hypothetical protein AAF195_02595 [Pseudomonadota bacterium]
MQVNSKTKHLITILGFGTNEEDAHRMKRYLKHNLFTFQEKRHLPFKTKHHVIGADNLSSNITSQTYNFLTSGVAKIVKQSLEQKIDALKSKIDELLEKKVTPENIYIQGYSLGAIAAVKVLGDAKYKNIPVILYDPVPDVNAILQSQLKPYKNGKVSPYLIGALSYVSPSLDAANKIYDNPDQYRHLDPIKSLVSDTDWGNFAANRKAVTLYFYSIHGDIFVNTNSISYITAKLKEIRDAPVFYRKDQRREHVFPTDKYHANILNEFIKYSNKPKNMIKIPQELNALNDPASTLKEEASFTKEENEGYWSPLTAEDPRPQRRTGVAI